MALDVDPVAVSGTWWRQVRAGINPVALPSPPADARWQRGSKVGGLYLADSTETAWAEWYRWLHEAALPPRVALPRDLARIAVEMVEVADLTTSQRLARVGLGLPRPTSGQWSGFQMVGEALHGQGLAGVLAPSAARDSGRVLCLFRAEAGTPGVTVELVRQFKDPPGVPPGLQA